MVYESKVRLQVQVASYKLQVVVKSTFLAQFLSLFEGASIIASSVSTVDSVLFRRKSKRMAEELFNVCVSSPPTFNEELFLKWVNGEVDDDSDNSIGRTAAISGGNVFDVFQFRHTSLTTTFSDDLMKLEIQEQYRMFDVLEHYISQPLLLSSQQMVLIPRYIQDIMIAYYWSLDNSVVREIVYKRLTKSRKDLDDVADVTGYPLKRVTRQFDNLRRIYTVAEDIQLQCNLQGTL